MTLEQRDAEANKEYVYGFGVDVFNGKEVNFVMTGDGLTQFHEVIFPEDKNLFALAISYGEGDGAINKLTTFEPGRAISSFNTGYMIKFSKVGSVDAAIMQLEKIRERLVQVELERTK